MKPALFAVLGLGLCACASPNAGNPDGAAYAGSSGSVYDVSANPPRADGTVRYNPNAPLPPDLPAAPVPVPAAPASMPQ